MGVISQKKADEIFRDINIVNGFYLMNYLAYWSLRLGALLRGINVKSTLRLESKKEVQV